MAKAEKKGLSERVIRELEDQIPEKASLATGQAYAKAKASGQTVLLSKDGYIVAERADGTEQVLYESKPRRKVKAGVSFKLGSGAVMNAGA